MFAASALGLCVGAVLVRRQQREAVMASVSAPTNGGLSPDKAMAALKEVLRKLDSEVPVLRGTEEGRRNATAALGELQATHIDTILMAREQIIAAGGLAGFATFMSAFAVMERQVNRAWSASADDAFDEVADCLKRAIVLAGDADALLPRK